jgi:hypothetical protein
MSVEILRDPREHGRGLFYLLESDGNICCSDNLCAIQKWRRSVGI